MTLLKKLWKLLRILFKTYEDLEYLTSTYQYGGEPKRTFIPVHLMCRRRSCQCGSVRSES